MSADTVSAAPTTEVDRFQQAVSAWRNLGLTELIPKLDAAAAELVEEQRNSLTQRKELAQKTKDFRKLEDAAKLVEIKTLLKSYQTFIDVLSKHTKTVSSAFLSAYTPLSEAPDPYPLLEASIESVGTAQDTVPKLEADNERLRAENAKLQTQLDDAEKQLEKERTSRQTAQDSQTAKISEVEKSWTAVLAEKEGNWQSREQALEDKVQNQDRLLRELKASYEVTQRLERAEGEDNGSIANTASAAEMDILNSELERANLRLSELESRNEQMRLDLAQSNTSTAASEPIEEQPAFLRLRSENTSLMRKLDSVRYEKDSEQGRLEMKMRGLERELGVLNSDCDGLRDKVKKWSDYEDLKQELDMIKAIEFSTGDDIGDTLSSGTQGGLQGGDGVPLEKLLLSRNKKLGDQVTELRMSQKDLEAQLENLQAELSNTNTDLEKAQKLNATLEIDLLQSQQHTRFDSSNMSVAGTHVSRAPKSSFGGRRVSPTSSIISGFDCSYAPSTRGGPGLESLRAGGADSTNNPAAAGILPMVTAQRDRFKKRISELESELAKSYQTVTSLRAEVASLQRDNLQLYEKTRYISSYSRPTAAGVGSHASAASGSGSDAQAAGSMDRYRSAYESKISPFAAFRGRESVRAFKRMTLPERVVYQITRIVLATRTSRNVFAVYCFGLHMMVILMLYWMGTGEVERSVPGLGAGSAGSAAGPIKAGGARGAKWQEAAFQKGQ